MCRKQNIYIYIYDSYLNSHTTHEAAGVWVAGMVFEKVVRDVQRKDVNGPGAA